MSFPTFGSTAPAGGTGFGAPAQGAAAGTTPFGGGTVAGQQQGFGFGAMAPATTAPTFGFGSTAPAVGTGFGAGTGFGFGSSTGFGAPAASTAPSTFGFGAASTAPATGFSGFGSTPATMGGLFTSGFGGTSGGFGSGGFSGFGAKTTAAAPTFGFGSGFGGTTTTAPALGVQGGFGFGGFQSNFQSGVMGQQQQQQQQLMGVPQISPTQALYNALFCCSKFGDERDSLLARWNVLQAGWGNGKGYYAQNAPPVDFTPENPFCRFKAIGYSFLCTNKTEEGLVSLTINKKDSDIRNQENQVISVLNGTMGNRPNLAVRIESVKPLSECKCLLVVYVEERLQTGAIRRVPASELSNHLLGQGVRGQLQSLGVEGVVPKVAATSDQLKDYMERPPAGIDPRLWAQAALDNPDPEHLVPVPMVGFGELQRRMKCQELETGLHQGRLDVIADDIAELQRRHTESLARMTDCRRKQLNLAHRVLKFIARAEAGRRGGTTLGEDEEQLRARLDALQAELSVPTQFKGRLNELLSQVQMQSQLTTGARSGTEKYAMGRAVQDDIKQFLKAQQEGISHLISIIKDDTEALRIIESGLKEKPPH